MVYKDNWVCDMNLHVCMGELTKLGLVEEWTDSIEDDILVAVCGSQEDLVASLELACLLDDTVVKDLGSSGVSGRHCFLCFLKGL